MPEQAYLKAIDTADKQVAAKEAELAELEGRLKANALSPDEARRTEKIDEYKNQINELSNKILDNPLEYRKNIKPIKSLSDKIYQDWTRGEMAAIQGNYDTRKAYSDKYDALVKAGKQRPQDKQAAMNYFDQNFAMGKGTQFKGAGDYKAYSTEEINPYMDVVDYVDKHGAGWKEDLESSLGGSVKQMGDGRYLVTSGETTRYVTEKEVNGALGGIIQNNPDFKAYYQQKVKFGQMTGEEAMKEMNSALAFATEKYGFKQTEKTLKYQVEKGWLEDKKLANKKAFHAYKKTQEKIGGMGLDYNNEQVKYTNVLGTNLQDYTKNLKEESMKGINAGLSIVNTIKKDVAAKLADGTMTPEEANSLYKIGKQAEAAIKNRDLNGLNALVKKAGFVDQKIVTEIEGLQKHATTMINYENQINTVREHFVKQAYAEERARVADRKKKGLGDYDVDLFGNKVYAGFDSKKVQGTVEERINGWLGDEKNNSTAQNIYSTQGGIFNLIDPHNQIDPKLKDQYAAAIMDVGSAVAANPEGWGSSFSIVGADGKLHNTSLSDLLAQGGIQMSAVSRGVKDADGNTTYGVGDKTVNIKNSEARLTLNKVNNEYQYQIPVIANGEAHQIYIPVSKIRNQKMDNVLGYLKPTLQTNEVVREAQRILGPLRTLKDPEKLNYQTDQPSIKYFPYAGQSKTPLWQVTDESSGDIKWFSDAEGQNIYKQTVQPTHGLTDYSFDAGGGTTGVSGSSSNSFSF
jgi:hypothetical protein